VTVESHCRAHRNPEKETPEGKRPEPLSIDGDTHSTSGGRILARRAELASKTAPLVAARRADHEQRADRRLQEVGRLGHRRERVEARSDLLVVPEDVVRDTEHG